MIIRRLSKSLKDQNWFAVGLDFLIVVISILIAFQITEWGESRVERQKEVRYLQEVVDDLNDTLNYIEFSVGVAERGSRAVESILDAAGIEPERIFRRPGNSAIVVEDLPAYETDYPDDVGFATIDADAPQIARNAYDAMISTGDIRLISDQGLARNIQRYYAFTVSYAGFDQYFEDARQRFRSSRHRLGLSDNARATVDDLAGFALQDPRFAAETQTFWLARVAQLNALRIRYERTAALIAAIEEATVR